VLIAGRDDRAGKPRTGSSIMSRSGIRTVFLIGFMGAGKTSVGRALGQSLGWDFVDLDERIQDREGRSIEQIFVESGESGFREVEHACLRDLVAESNSSRRIVALGGGACIQARNEQLLASDGMTVVCLHAPAEELFRRCQQEPVTRPLRGDIEQFCALYKKRESSYAKADLLIDTNGKEVEQVTEEIAAKLGLS
jgi:shikimate kinase